ncbi:Hypothetical predicted protein [Paramuricea clavata]|uniref:Uncharacterized protein n=1 Tax=Paramuricea clavata TaxID=317549 RepID=A0A7D9EHT2_PARCT|nr:Hypothetical predicted protein [Paramuricea clavata]
MSKRKSKPTTVEELEIEMEAAAAEVVSAAEDVEATLPDTQKTANTNLSTEEKRAALIVMSEDGELEKSVELIRKANRKTINKIYQECERRRKRKADEFLTDLIISKFACLLGGLNAISDSEELNKELMSDELLRGDVCRAVAMITPYVPFLGILSGGITTVKHIADRSLTGGAGKEVATTEEVKQ